MRWTTSSAEEYNYYEYVFMLADHEDNKINNQPVQVKLIILFVLLTVTFVPLHITDNGLHRLTYHLQSFSHISVPPLGQDDNNNNKKNND